MFLPTALLLMSFFLSNPHLARGHNLHNHPPSATNCTANFCRVDLSPELTKSYRILIPGGFVVNDGGDCPGCKITVRLSYYGLAWLGVGVSRVGGMVGSHVVIGEPGISEPKFYRLNGKSKLQVIASDDQPLEDASIEFIDGHTVMEFTSTFENFGLETGLATDLGTAPLGINLNGKSTFIWAHGNDGEKNLSYHGGINRDTYTLYNMASLNDISEKEANVMMQAEIPATYHQSIWRAHGILAFFAWGLFAPTAIASALFRDEGDASIWTALENVLARVPKESRFHNLVKTWWFYIHIIANSASYLFTIVVFSIAVAAISRENSILEFEENDGDEEDEDHHEGGHWEHPHSKMGLAMFLIASFQVFGGYLRPSKSDALNNCESLPSPSLTKSNRRLVWELIHNVVGISLFLCGVWQMYQGILLYHERYNSNIAAFGGFYFIWMGVWTFVIVGGFIYKWLLRTGGNSHKAQTGDDDQNQEKNIEGEDHVDSGKDGMESKMGNEGNIGLDDTKEVI